MKKKRKILVDEEKLIYLTGYIELLENVIDFEHKAKRMLENRAFCKWVVKYFPNLKGDSKKDLVAILKGKDPFGKLKM